MPEGEIVGAMTSAPLSAPLAVRKAMEDWDFRTATAMLDKSYEVLTALQEAIALLPEADIFPIIAPDFEAAPDAAARITKQHRGRTIRVNSKISPSPAAIRPCRLLYNDGAFPTGGFSRMKTSCEQIPPVLEGGFENR